MKQSTDKNNADKNNGIWWTMWTHLNDLDFVHDPEPFLSHSQQQMQENKKAMQGQAVSSTVWTPAAEPAWWRVTGSTPDPD